MSHHDITFIPDPDADSISSDVAGFAGLLVSTQIPTRADGTFLPISRSTRMSPNWTYWNKKNTSAFAEIEHRFDNDWKLRLNTTWLRGAASHLPYRIRCTLRG